MEIDSLVSDRVVAGSALQVYLLGLVEFEAALNLQRRLVYEISGDRDAAALILCEHPPTITVGRQGSRAHILADLDELRLRRWPVRWVNRGGGCLLHVPGQLAIYPILALDRLQLGIDQYLHRLQQVVIASLDDFFVRGETRAGQSGVWVGQRPILGTGVAVRDWVTYYGAAFNINPALEPFRWVRYGGLETAPMTSLERERRGPLRPALVRERLVEHFVEQFGFARTILFSDSSSVRRRARSDAVATSS